MQVFEGISMENPPKDKQETVEPETEIQDIFENKW